MFATRGRGGGTFVSDPQPPTDPPSPQMLALWRETCDQRLAVELGVAVLAAERADRADLDALDELAAALEGALEDFAAYRQADVRLHVGLAEATRSTQLVRAMTEAQGAMTDLIAYIAHPPQVLSSSNAQHRRLLAAVRERDAMRAAQRHDRAPAGHRAHPRGPAAGRLIRSAWPPVRRKSRRFAPTALDIRPRSSVLSRMKDGHPNLFSARGQPMSTTESLSETSRGLPSSATNRS